MVSMIKGEKEMKGEEREPHLRVIRFHCFLNRGNFTLIVFKYYNQDYLNLNYKSILLHFSLKVTQSVFSSSDDRAERHDLKSRLWLFFFPLFLIGMRKRE
jgi:hypothetical protein